MLLRTALIGVLCGACAHAPAETASSAPLASLPAVPPAQATTAAEFARDIRPILESRCQPCHFPGGRMYDRLPFDRPETIRQLGPKLFTRIKDESSQATIRAFLSQSP